MILNKTRPLKIFFQIFLPGGNAKSPVRLPIVNSYGASSWYTLAVVNGKRILRESCALMKLSTMVCLIAPASHGAEMPVEESPDPAGAATEFPATMEIDYVRVYSGAPEPE